MRLKKSEENSERERLWNLLKGRKKCKRKKS